MGAQSEIERHNKKWRGKSEMGGTVRNWGKMEWNEMEEQGQRCQVALKEMVGTLRNEGL